MNRSLFTSAAVCALVAGTSLAHANVEVGGTAGVHVFSDTNELGVPDTSTADSERNSALFGVRLGVFFTKMIGIEGEFGIIPSEGRQMVYDIWNITYRAQLVAQYIKGDDTKSKLIPFALVGAGGTSVVSTDANGDPAKVGKDTDFAFYAGIGAKYRVDNGWGLRGDLRILFPPSSSGDGSTQDYEILLSIYKEFGRKKPAPVVVDKDTDGDGIPDSKDKCPTEKEDKDGYQDQDGCPDPDNDGDGVLDAADKCPDQKEDIDGFQDQDGCPDPDNDGDGIPDAQDGKDGACKDQPEDKDGFQDQDGCPDPDNDNDGIPDEKDQCKNEPETINGYQDQDGCPDTVPEKVKKFSGTIKGINFQTGSATILSSSNAVLDEAVKVLVEFKDVKIEVQGHTDDQAFTAPKNAKIHDNQELSQARADSVKDYMVKKGVDASRIDAKGYGDTQPVTDPKGLTGAKLTAARAQNRRVDFKLITKP